MDKKKLKRYLILSSPVFLLFLIFIIFKVLFFGSSTTESSVSMPKVPPPPVKESVIKKEPVKVVSKRKFKKEGILLVDGATSNFFVLDGKIYKKGDKIFNETIKKYKNFVLELENGYKFYVEVK